MGKPFLRRRKSKLVIRTTLTPKQRRVYEKKMKELDRKLKPITDAIRDSQRITAKDLAIIINAK